MANKDRIEYKNDETDEGCLGGTLDSCVLPGAEEIIDRRKNLADASQELQSLEYNCDLCNNTLTVHCPHQHCKTVLKVTR
jgi:hypothetical protein